MAALHSEEAADLRGSLGSDAQTVTALALCQASLVWPSAAMVSLGHKYNGGAMFGLGLLSPMATQPWASVPTRTMKGCTPTGYLCSQLCQLITTRAQPWLELQCWRQRQPVDVLVSLPKLHGFFCHQRCRQMQCCSLLGLDTISKTNLFSQPSPTTSLCKPRHWLREGP